MRRHGWIGIIILVLIIACIWLIKAPLMSSYLSSKMKVPVSVGTIGMWPKHTSIHNFKIMNPRGFKNPTALRVERTKIDYRFGNLIGNPSEIDEITLDGVHLTIELLNSSGTENNWTAIGEKIPKKKSGHEVIIHKLIITNMTVDVTGGPKIIKVAGTRNFDRMEFNEIDSREGFPTEELINRIFERAGLLKYIQGLFNPTNTIKKATHPFNIFGQ